MMPSKYFGAFHVRHSWPNFIYLIILLKPPLSKPVFHQRRAPTDSFSLIFSPHTPTRFTRASLLALVTEVLMRQIPLLPYNSFHYSLRRELWITYAIAGADKTCPANKLAGGALRCGDKYSEEQQEEEEQLASAGDVIEIPTAHQRLPTAGFKSDAFW